MRIYSVIIVFWIAVFSFQSATAQLRLSGDDLYKFARELAFDGQRDSAIKVLTIVLANNPDYDDVEVFLGRVHAWDRRYDTAVVHLANVLNRDPKNRECYKAFVDVMYWNNQHEQVIDMANTGMKHHPTNEHLLLRKAQAQDKLGRHRFAAYTINLLLDIHPTHKEGLKMRKELAKYLPTQQVGLTHSIDHFNRIYDTQNLTSIDYTKRTSIGSIIGRVNLANKFDQRGLQYEVDAYPHIRKGMYAYLNAGVSQSSIFPQFRAGGELYQSLKHSFEASLGARYLQFSASQVLMLTGSIGKYSGNYWISFRPFITPRPSGISKSFSIETRRYFKTANDYWQLIVGSGVSPDDRNRITGEESTYYRQSFKIGGGVHLAINNAVMVMGRYVYTTEESEQNSLLFIRRYHISMGLKYSF